LRADEKRVGDIGVGTARIAASYRWLTGVRVRLQARLYFCEDCHAIISDEYGVKLSGSRVLLGFVPGVTLSLEDVWGFHSK